MNKIFGRKLSRKGDKSDRSDGTIVGARRIDLPIGDPIFKGRTIGCIAELYDDQISSK